jgi:hypothetical protein
MKALVALIALIAFSTACAATETNTPTSPVIGAASTPPPTYTPTATPVQPGYNVIPHPLANGLELHVGVSPFTLGDEKITFSLDVHDSFESGTSNLFFDPLYSSHKTVFYDLRVFTEDGTLFWWLSKDGPVEISLDEIKTSHGSQRWFAHEWDTRGNCPSETLEGHPSGDCPRELAKTGLYRVAATVGYYPDPDDPTRQFTIESVPHIFYILPKQEVLLNALKVQVEAFPSTWKEGSELYRPYWAQPYSSYRPAPPSPSPGDPAITFTVRVKNTSDSFLYVSHSSAGKNGAGLFDLKILSEDGEVV